MLKKLTVGRLTALVEALDNLRIKEIDYYETEM